MKISDCRAFSPFKTLPGCRAFRHSEKNIGIQVHQFPTHPILPSMPFLIFHRDHLRSSMGIICGPIWGSFALRDHLRSWDHLRTRTDPYRTPLLSQSRSEHDMINCSAVVDHSTSTGHNIVGWDHFEILRSGQCDILRTIKETLLYGP